MKTTRSVVPAGLKRGSSQFNSILWISAFAGMTIFILSSQASRACAENLVLEDFYQRGGPNKIGGLNGVWKKGGAKISLYYEKGSAEKSQPGSAADGYALKLKFDVGMPGQEAGWWTGMKSKSLEGFGQIQFWVKGENGGEDLWVGVKDSLWFESRLPVINYLPGGVAKTWNRVSVPLQDFDAIHNWRGIENISFALLHGGSPADQGSIVLDQVELVRDPNGIKASPLEKLTRPKPNLSDLTDDQFLDLIERSCFDYFVGETNPDNGLVKDLCMAFARDNYSIASTAAVGFGLTAWCIGAQRGWIKSKDAYEMALRTLHFFANQAEHEKGFYYHFLDMQSGERAMDCEISSVDTALFLAGALFAGRYFEGTEVESLAQELYRRTDWGWLLTDDGFVGMGWAPEKGFLRAQWEDYSELMIIYLMAIGSPTHPISPRAWDRWSREKRLFGDIAFTGGSSLFIHQYSHCWVDFRNIRDRHMDYFENSRKATLANRQWCLNKAKRFKTFAQGLWGITACDGSTGYTVFGAPFGYSDGTIAPAAAVGSIVFTPQESLSVLKLMYKVVGSRGWGRYGFVDSFNLDSDWFSEKNIGINLGPMVLMIENYRTGFVWKTFGTNGWLVRALKLCEFKEAQRDPIKKTTERKGL